MSSEPKPVRLGDVCRIKQGRYVAPSEMKESASGSHTVPVVGGNGVLGFVDRGTHDFGVPLVTCRGSRCGLMQWAEPPTWVSNNAMAVYFENDHGDNYFLYHYLRTQNFDDVTTGTAQPQITVSSLSQKTVLLPASPSQKAIGRLMRLFEKKIQSNRRTAELLEGLASSIFRSWFIDFDPVKAKMAGESPVGMDAETAALFPDSMEESELGEIPRGWRVSNIGSSVQLAGGATPSTKNPEFWDGEYSWLTPKDLSGRRQKIAPTSSRKITLQGLERISSGLLEKGTVLLSSRAPIGYTAICATETAINQGFIALKADELFPPMYLLNWIESNMQEVLNRAGGATFAEVSKAAFRDIPFLCPDAAILRCYRDVTAPIVGQLELLETQNRSLAELRDGLLPRLISGELEIPEEMLAA